MRREDAQEHYSDYITGSLDKAKTVALENHLKSDPQSREEVEALRSVWETLDRAPMVETPAFFHENLMRRIEMEEEKAAEALTLRKKGWSWKSLLQPKSLAAFGAAAVLVLSFTQARHTSGASLNPLEPIIRLFKSDADATSMATKSAKWQVNSLGKGELHIHLYGSTGAGSRYVVKSDGATIAEAALQSPKGDSEIVLPMPEPPKPGSLTINVTNAHGDAVLADKLTVNP